MRKIFALAQWNLTLPLPPPQAARQASLPEMMCFCECHGSFCALPPHATLVFCSHQSHWGIFKHFIFRMLFSSFSFFLNFLPSFQGTVAKSDYNGCQACYITFHVLYILEHFFANYIISFSCWRLGDSFSQYRVKQLFKKSSPSN